MDFLMCFSDLFAWFDRFPGKFNPVDQLQVVKVGEALEGRRSDGPAPAAVNNDRDSHPACASSLTERLRLSFIGTISPVTRPYITRHTAAHILHTANINPRRQPCFVSATPSNKAGNSLSLRPAHRHPARTAQLPMCDFPVNLYQHHTKHGRQRTEGPQRQAL